MRNKIIIILAIFVTFAFIGFNIEASLAPQVYFTGINLEKRVFEPGEEINGFAILWNYEDLVLSDLVFHYQLLGNSINGVPTRIIDSQVDEEKFSLGPDREMRKVFNYTLPSNLPQGIFKFRIQATNSRGEEMNWIDKVVEIRGDNRFLTLSDYWLIKNEEKLHPGAGVDFLPGEIPEIEFKVKNESFHSLKVFPKITAYKRNVGEVLDEENGQEVVLNANEEKIQKLSLFQFTEPNVYLAEVRFYESGTKEPISNSIYFRWVINGEDAEILFVRPDKIFYKAGEEAKMEIQIAGPANGRTIKGKGVIELKLFDPVYQDSEQESGKQEAAIGSAQKEIDLKNSKLTMNVPVNKDVNGPEVEAKITKDGRLIDEYNFRIIPEMGLAAASSPSRKNLDFWFRAMRVIQALSLLLFLAAIIYYFLRIKKGIKNYGPLIK